MYVVPLTSPAIDVVNVKEFLEQSCGFKDINCIEDEPSNVKIIENSFAQLNEVAKNVGKEKILFFVYYSGHGTVFNGSTHGHTLDGTPFDIETLIKRLAMRPNIVVVSILDCCRVERKGGPPKIEVDARIKGQLALIHATQYGRMAPGAGNLEKGSMVTNQILDTLKKSPFTFPKSIQIWAKNHTAAQFTDKMPFEIALRLDTEIVSVIPESLCSWTK